MENAILEQWLMERLSGVGGLEAVRDYEPRSNDQRIIVFQEVDSSDTLVQERDPVYFEAIYDVLIFTERGCESYPYEQKELVHRAIKTGDAVTYDADWVGEPHTWSITCDRQSGRNYAVQDEAGDYRVCMARYILRLQEV